MATIANYLESNMFLAVKGHGILVDKSKIDGSLILYATKEANRDLDEAEMNTLQKFMADHHDELNYIYEGIKNYIHGDCSAIIDADKILNSSLIIVGVTFYMHNKAFIKHK